MIRIFGQDYEDSDYDMYDGHHEDSDYEEKNYNRMDAKREAYLIRQLQLIIYLGPLYKKCDSRKKGVTKKDLQSRLDYLKKNKTLDRDCSLESFIKICKLHQVPSKADKCFKYFSLLVESLTVDRLKYLIADYTITSEMMDILLEGHVKLSIDVLLTAIYRNFDEQTVYQILKRLNDKRLEFENSENAVIINNSRISKENITVKIINYYDNIIDDLLDYFNLSTYFDQFVEIYSSKLTDYKIVKAVMDKIDPEEFKDIPVITNTILDILYMDISEDIIDDFNLFIENLRKYDPKLIEKVRNRVQELIRDYGIEHMDMVRALVDVKFLESDFDADEYKEEMEPRRIQREQGIQTVNVHDISTNTANNRVVKALLPNPNKERDIINIEATRAAAKEFIQILEAVNIERLDKGKKPFDIKEIDILLCQNYFYDFGDKLLGRDKTAPGEGVEVCNVFLAIWSIAKDQLSGEELIAFSSRLAEELESILNRDEEQKQSEPVCSTGWVTRLVNSLFGFAIDVGVVPEPDLNAIKDELNKFAVRQRAELDDTDAEAVEFDDSVAMISDDNFANAKSFVDRRLKLFIDKTYQEYKYSNIKKSKLRQLSNEALEKLFVFNI